MIRKMLKYQNYVESNLIGRVSEANPSYLLSLLTNYLFSLKYFLFSTALGIDVCKHGLTIHLLHVVVRVMPTLRQYCQFSIGAVAYFSGRVSTVIVLEFYTLTFCLGLFAIRV
jgi:hypothetical protein